jgi:oligopeptide/dipeptide ABC transporter ATP-binding protein
LVRIARVDEILVARSDQLSGGMRQRVVIAAAIAAQPRLLIADEPTTALDASIQHEILKLLVSLRRELGMALLLVTHDLAVVEETCDRISVMYAGASMEDGPVDELLEGSLHPYTRALRDSSIHHAIPGTRIPAILGDPVSVGAWPDGCRFHPRCAFVAPECSIGRQPELESVDMSRTACLRWRELPR